MLHKRPMPQMRRTVPYYVIMQQMFWIEEEDDTLV